ncbi:integrase domain-containing protein [Vibrio superstes]|uniref:Integrase catalytic domain-containing protein n=1 Tax=Vibrio superstes NBRC 103154 TaxID=1219062 RepID=A0A511QMG7_9VIBR|nr:integrase domain-containing protein [Vibrio superstes]GEM78509.1 hypothetical protein VSU01S_07540 [Vibrio superstes NBRC 103154]
MTKRQYSGVMPSPLRNFNKPNFGLGARQIDRGLINASLERVGDLKDNTHKARISACRDFAQYLKDETDVKRLIDIEKAHVVNYGEHLRARFESDVKFTASTARDYISHINVCMAQARGDDKLNVTASKELDYPPKSGIATVDRSTTLEQHQAILHHASEPVALAAQLERTLGLRTREACLLDSHKALVEYKKTGVITVGRGTKGGQPRMIPIENDEQITALERGEKLQETTGHNNLVPVDQSFKAFQSHIYKETKAIDPIYNCHGERKFFACQFYQTQMGVEAPVRVGIEHGRAHHEYIAKTLCISLSEAKARDKAVRLQLSKIMGHHRPGITNAYLG